jgi:hypothetical protein
VASLVYFFKHEVEKIAVDKVVSQKMEQLSDSGVINSVDEYMEFMAAFKKI